MSPASRPRRFLSIRHCKSKFSLKLDNLSSMHYFLPVNFSSVGEKPTFWNIFKYRILIKLGLFGRKDIWSSWGIYRVFEVAPLIRTAISFTAILVLLLGLPLGQQELLNKTVDPLLLKPHGSIQAQRDEINLERGYIKRRVSFFHGEKDDLEAGQDDSSNANV
jgi:hypothetical protein